MNANSNKNTNGLTYSLVLALAALAIATYVNSLYGGFVYDDVYNVLANRWITDVKYLYEIFTTHSAGFSADYSARYYRPLVHVILMLDYHLFGLQAWGYHLVNVIIHLLTSVMVYFISLKLFADISQGSRNTAALAAFASAALFAVHPIHSEAVSWVSGVMDISYSLLYLVSFYLYVKAYEDAVMHPGFYLLSLVAFFAAALCKEPALTLPAVLFAYDRIYDKCREESLYGVFRYLPYAAVAAAYIAMRWRALGGFLQDKSPASLGPYLDTLNIPKLFSGYMGKLVLPVNLNVDYVFHPARSVSDPGWLVSMIVVAAIAVLAYAVRRNRPAVMGIAMTVIPLAPALYLPALGVSALADRYLYLPSAGFTVVLASLLLAAAGGLSGKRAVAAAVVLAAVLGAYCSAAIIRNLVWHDNISLWTDSTDKSPDNPVSLSSLGFALASAGRLGEAVEHYKVALRYDPDDAYTHLNLGTAYKQMGKEDMAAEQYNEALKLKPELVDARYNLANHYLDTGRYDDAVSQYADLLEVRPDYAKAFINMGVAYLYLGRNEKAEECFRSAIRLDPVNPEAHNNLGTAYAREGRMDLAEASFKTAAGLDPSNISYRQNLKRAAATRP